MTAGGVRFARKKGGWTNLTALKRPFPSFSLIPSFVSAVRWLDLNGGRRTPGHDDPPPRRGAGSSRAAFFRRSRCGPKWVRCDGVEIKDIVLYYIIVSYCYTIYISIYIYILIYMLSTLHLDVESNRQYPHSLTLSKSKPRFHQFVRYTPNTTWHWLGFKNTCPDGDPSMVLQHNCRSVNRGGFFCRSAPYMVPSPMRP